MQVVAPPNFKRLVVKVGTSSLTHPDGLLHRERMSRLAGELAALWREGREVILVTSGAVGAGMGRLGLSERPRTLPEKQALAAVGQGLLMHTYGELFAAYGQVVAQVLLTGDDLADRGRYLNARHTFATLLQYRVLPIVNENDTVAVEEIRLGDNDTLSALVAGLVDADLLIILSDTAGLFTGDPRSDAGARPIPVVREITPALERLAGGAGALGTGGMATKLAAARLAMEAGIPLALASSEEPGVLERLVRGEGDGATWFLPPRGRLGSRARWILSGSPVRGTLVVDAGAAEALLVGGKSLLPIGVRQVEGRFRPGNVVRVTDAAGNELARGIVNYSAADLRRIMGHASQEIARILGYKDYDEVIHRNNLVLCRNGQQAEKGDLEE